MKPSQNNGNLLSRGRYYIAFNGFKESRFTQSINCMSECNQSGNDEYFCKIRHHEFFTGIKPIIKYFYQNVFYIKTLKCWIYINSIQIKSAPLTLYIFKEILEVSFYAFNVYWEDCVSSLHEETGIQREGMYCIAWPLDSSLTNAFTVMPKLCSTMRLYEAMLRIFESRYPYFHLARRR